MTVRIPLPELADTHDLGRRLGRLLRQGDLVVLTGPLGAGKTVLVQGIGDGLGVRGDVTSPTFVIARVHQPDPARGGTLTLVHADAYRLGDAPDPRAEIDDLDLDADMDRAVTVVEWGEGMVEQLAEAHLLIRMHRAEDDSRTAEVTGLGPGWSGRLAALDQPAGHAGR
ncbi:MULTISPECIES: tRNA (adenosine(37)-N6)-threonylcarbamoyltransferase complex ATPase subunit type 1 TsaE [unclassified Micromonospora]|uniref:tRNA (adenosine(37)-N6)-threonylcarbamoyltransferase complex ATPase subunit type 1 TsaE n=1 Tax=unclassified Micromonospora TaxID=2617518 RepID=UPI003A847681